MLPCPQLEEQEQLMREDVADEVARYSGQLLLHKEVEASPSSTAMGSRLPSSKPPPTAAPSSIGSSAQDGCTASSQDGCLDKQQQQQGSMGEVSCHGNNASLSGNGALQGDSDSSQAGAAGAGVLQDGAGGMQEGSDGLGPATRAPPVRSESGGQGDPADAILEACRNAEMKGVKGVSSGALAVALEQYLLACSSFVQKSGFHK